MKDGRVPRHRTADRRGAGRAGNALHPDAGRERAAAAHGAGGLAARQVREREVTMSDADVQRYREQIAAATRLLVMQEIIDFSGHLSVRIPGTDRVLIQPRDTSRAALTADDVLVVDLDNKVLEGEG